MHASWAGLGDLQQTVMGCLQRSGRKASPEASMADISKNFHASDVEVKYASIYYFRVYHYFKKIYSFCILFLEYFKKIFIRILLIDACYKRRYYTVQTLIMN